MKSIKVNKPELLAVLRKNRDEHRETFLQAQAAYRETVIAVLDEELNAAKNGRLFVLARITALVQPSDHTDDYNRVIGMVEMDTATTVELDEREYSQYVDDNWGWMMQFANEVTSYGVSNAKLARYAH